MTEKQREVKQLIENRLATERGFDGLKFEIKETADHVVLIAPGFWPEIHLGPRGGISLPELHSYPPMRDGTGGTITALVKNANWGK